MGRQQLQDKLLTHAPEAWYQPPASKRLNYPCFVYKAKEPTIIRADNIGYLIMPSYEVLYISAIERDDIWEEMMNDFEHISIGRKYVSDNLYHYPFTINFK